MKPRDVLFLMGLTFALIVALWVGFAALAPSMPVSAQNAYQTSEAVPFDNTATLSAPINLTGKYVVGIQMPASWTTANITFQGSHDCSTYANVYDVYGTEYTITTAASRFINVPPAAFAGVTCLKLRSGTSGTPVTQTVTPTLQLIWRPL